METIAYRSLPIDQSDVRYEHGPDSVRRPGTPAGETIELSLPTSSVYPGTTRRVWVHVPACRDPAKPAALVVFQDGWWYLDPDGEVRGGIVLDNLVHAGDLPPTTGVFVDPGVFSDVEDPDGRKNRNAEYDAFDDRYATFVLDEVLPVVVEQRWALSEDPAHRAICGGSSGGNCAATAAWLRPDRFGRVVGFLSSFAQIPGGNPYPELIPATPRKPLRVFLATATSAPPHARCSPADRPRIPGLIWSAVCQVGTSNSPVIVLGDQRRFGCSRCSPLGADR